MNMTIVRARAPGQWAELYTNSPSSHYTSSVSSDKSCQTECQCLKVQSCILIPCCDAFLSCKVHGEGSSNPGSDFMTQMAAYYRVTHQVVPTGLFDIKTKVKFVNMFPIL